MLVRNLDSSSPGAGLQVQELDSSSPGAGLQVQELDSSSPGAGLQVQELDSSSPVAGLPFEFSLCAPNGVVCLFKRSGFASFFLYPGEQRLS